DGHPNVLWAIALDGKREVGPKRIRVRRRHPESSRFLASHARGYPAPDTAQMRHDASRAGYPGLLHPAIKRDATENGYPDRELMQLNKRPVRRELRDGIPDATHHEQISRHARYVDISIRHAEGVGDGECLQGIPGYGIHPRDPISVGCACDIVLDQEEGAPIWLIGTADHVAVAEAGREGIDYGSVLFVHGIDLGRTALPVDEQQGAGRQRGAPQVYLLPRKGDVDVVRGFTGAGHRAQLLPILRKAKDGAGGAWIRPNVRGFRIQTNPAQAACTWRVE